MKKSLTGQHGAEWFVQNLRDAVIPGGAYGVQRFRATVASATPADTPDRLAVVLAGEEKPEAELLLKAPWKAPIPNGTQVEFAGVSRSFQAEPFLLTVKVISFDVLPIDPGNR